jgi:hypothetical protein
MVRYRAFLVAAVVVLLEGGALLAAEDENPVKEPKGGALGQLYDAQQKFGWPALQDLFQGEPRKIRSFFTVVLGAIVLGAILAFHPFAGRKNTLEDLEQPKIIITYTVVGALVAIVVSAMPAMGFAIFGIGALMRFRTELSAAKETGRVILATVLGLACGLEFWMVAIVGTVIAWILIFVLESRIGLRMVVRGVRSETIGQTAEAYGKILQGMRCSFTTPRKNPTKGQVSFVVRARRSLEPELIEAECNAKIPKEIRGTLDWPED